MADRLRWWVIPGAMFVLVRVVTLDAKDDVFADGVPTEASAPAGEVVIAEANGRRLGPIAIDTAGAASIHVPGAWCGERGDMTVWRRVAGAREAAPWLVLRPRSRADGTIPLLGLAAGRYDFELRFDGTTLRADDVFLK